MSSRTSSRSTLTTVPSTISPSLKYLMVSSIAARKASSEPMSLTATCGVEVACVLLVVMCELAPDTDRIGFGRAMRSASDIEAGVPDHQHQPGTLSASGLHDHGGLRKITTHRSAYESVARRSIAATPCQVQFKAQ